MKVPRSILFTGKTRGEMDSPQDCFIETKQEMAQSHLLLGCRHSAPELFISYMYGVMGRQFMEQFVSQSFETVIHGVLFEHPPRNGAARSTAEGM